MSSTTTLRLLVLSLYLCLNSLLFSSHVLAQTFKFRNYVERDGLSSKYINTLNQDDRGYLLTGTGEGLYSFNGFRFSKINGKDSTFDAHITTSTQDSSGTIWYGHNNGDLSQYRRGQLTTVHSSKQLGSRVEDIYISGSTIFLLTQNNGIATVSANGEIQLYKEGLEEFLFSCFLRDSEGSFWLGSDLGLIKATLGANGKWTSSMIEQFPITNVTDLVPLGNNGFIAATEDAGLFYIKTNRGNVEVNEITCEGIDLHTVHIHELRIDAQKNIWLSTNNDGLVRLSEPQDMHYRKFIRFAEEGAQVAMSVRTAFMDREGNLWIGTIGSGLLKLEDDYFSIYHLEGNVLPTSISTSGDSLWMGSDQLLQIFDRQPGKLIATFSKNNGIPASNITCIHRDEYGRTWLGTGTYGVWYCKAGSEKFSKFTLSYDNLNNKINGIASQGNIMYVATDYGVYILENDKVKDHLSIENGLSGNVVKSVYIDRQQRVWLGTITSELAYLDNGQLRNLVSPLPNTHYAVRCITEDANGDIWMGTEGFGIVNITHPKNYFVQKESGLHSDYCYSIHGDAQNRIWVGHRGALSRYDVNKAEVEVFFPAGEDEEISFFENAVAQNRDGLIFFATDHGILRYDPSKDKKNTIEPIVNFDQLAVNDSIWGMTDALNLPYGDYKIEVFFTGVSLRRPDKVTYQFILEGYETEWSKPSTINFARYLKLGPGDYTFKVKCFNADGAGGTTIKEIRIHIEQPFWMQWWFWALCGAILFALVRTIIHMRERQLKENQEYLKRALDERTREVVTQKELLELKNQDITDSILYAKNIQEAILPSPGLLQLYFEEAFILFKPRDIVSGDFHWSAQFGDKLLVACADCTGHGVPGAFMSIIGNALLNQVASKDYVQSPSELLSELDKEVFHLLNRKTQDFFVDDGMDISLIEYDRSTRVLRVSSANRPVLLIKNGETIEIRGDRRAIGGSSAQRGGAFTIHEFALEKGDSIYLFSDGVTDQFGGADGKKLKRARFVSWINALQQTPMKQQEAQLSAQLSEWRGALPQIDDMIVIGMRV